MNPEYHGSSYGDLIHMFQEAQSYDISISTKVLIKFGNLEMMCEELRALNSCKTCRVK
jgi:hypothetical protein